MCLVPWLAPMVTSPHPKDLSESHRVNVNSGGSKRLVMNNKGAASGAGTTAKYCDKR